MGRGQRRGPVQAGQGLRPTVPGAAAVAPGGTRPRHVVAAMPAGVRRPIARRRSGAAARGHGHGGTRPFRWRDRPRAPGPRSPAIRHLDPVRPAPRRGGTRRPDAAAPGRARPRSSANASAARPSRSQVAARFTRVETRPGSCCSESTKQRSAACSRWASKCATPSRKRVRACSKSSCNGIPDGSRGAPVVLARHCGRPRVWGPGACVSPPLNRVVVPQRAACETARAVGHQQRSGRRR